MAVKGNNLKVRFGYSTAKLRAMLRLRGKLKLNREMNNAIYTELLWRKQGRPCRGIA